VRFRRAGDRVHEKAGQVGWAACGSEEDLQGGSHDGDVNQKTKNKTKCIAQQGLHFVPIFYAYMQKMTADT